MAKFQVYHKEKEWSYNMEDDNSTIAMWRGMGMAESDGFLYPICKVCTRRGAE